MLHPIFSLLVRRPDLIADHLSGYSALVHEEVSSLGTELVERAVAVVVAAVAMVTFLTLAGVAVLIGAVNGFHWTQLVVPGVALAIAIAGALFAKKPMTSDRFAEVKQQVHADLATLRAAGDPS